uniref:Uncharacterized protein n=1 Tax=Cacopsylla melanoneura TaxID=428564 RepID=A0A8D8Z8K1_9HEMI
MGTAGLYPLLNQTRFPLTLDFNKRLTMESCFLRKSLECTLLFFFSSFPFEISFRFVFFDSRRRLQVEGHCRLQSIVGICYSVRWVDLSKVIAYHSQIRIA